MVLRLKKHPLIFFSFFSLCITFLFSVQYLSRTTLPIGHDTFFHLSRIEGLATSIKHHDYLPSIYPLKNNGFGYISPMFYADVLLYPFAIVYLWGVSIVSSYKLVIYVWTFLACLSMMYCVYRLSRKSVKASILAGILYTFNNYHVSDVFVRGALGEVQALIFLPLLLLGLYEIYEEENKRPLTYLFALIGLVLSHNLTFLSAVVFVVIVSLCYVKKFIKKMGKTVILYSFLAFLFTAFYTIPMLDMMKSDTFILHYYAKNSDLAAYALPLWKYFANTTVFGFGDNASEKQMLLNVGYTMMFSGLLLFVRKDLLKRKFIRICLIVGYVCLFLPSSFVPWDALSVFRVLQFPWRLLTMASLLLCVFASLILESVLQKKVLFAGLCTVLIGEGLYHVLPYDNTTFAMNTKTKWSDITSGTYIDPYYSATYMRVELAGGDYLPLSSIDFRKITQTIYDTDMQVAYVPFEKHYHTLTFQTSSPQTYILPLTYYKGYHAYRMSKDQKTEIPLSESAYGLVEINVEEEGTYQIVYEGTIAKKICVLLSGLSIVGYCLLLAIRRKKNPLSQK